MKPHYRLLFLPRKEQKYKNINSPTASIKYCFNTEKIQPTKGDHAKTFSVCPSLTSCQCWYRMRTCFTEPPGLCKLCYLCLLPLPDSWSPNRHLRTSQDIRLLSITGIWTTTSFCRRMFAHSAWTFWNSLPYVTCHQQTIVFRSKCALKTL